ncbi:MAG: acyl-CoA dehydrogenase family protein, partial [Candidatus Accumulibacter sp.]|nr:acyl-CoA dehydrogenase family protein [Accumulibacter sp.]
TKMWITNGPDADTMVVYAKTDPGIDGPQASPPSEGARPSSGGRAAGGGARAITAFIVEKGMKGFSTAQKLDKLGMRGSHTGEMVFDNVEVPAENVLGSVGGGASVFGTAMDWERSLLVAAHVGTIERLLDTSISYARTRSQFGQTIGKFQAVSHKIADMKVHLEAARLLVYRTASRLTTTRSISLDAAVTKLFVSESLVKTALDAVQLHGGYGFMEEYEVERALRDAIGSTLYSGTSEMQRNIIARWLGV